MAFILDQGEKGDDDDDECKVDSFIAQLHYLVSLVFYQLNLNNLNLKIVESARKRGSGPPVVTLDRSAWTLIPIIYTFRFNNNFGLLESTLVFI